MRSCGCEICRAGCPTTPYMVPIVAIFMLTGSVAYFGYQLVTIRQREYGYPKLASDAKRRQKPERLRLRWPSLIIPINISGGAGARHCRVKRMLSLALRHRWASRLSSTRFRGVATANRELPFEIKDHYGRDRGRGTSTSLHHRAEGRGTAAGIATAALEMPMLMAATL